MTAVSEYMSDVSMRVASFLTSESTEYFYFIKFTTNFVPSLDPATAQAVC
jgi:hypothetical protein